MNPDFSFLDDMRVCEAALYCNLYTSAKKLARAKRDLQDQAARHGVTLVLTEHVSKHIRHGLQVNWRFEDGSAGSGEVFQFRLALGGKAV